MDLYFIRKNKWATIGVAEYFRDANFPGRAGAENRKAKEAAVFVYDPLI